MRHIHNRLATVFSVVGAAAFTVACGSERQSNPPEDDATIDSCTGGSSGTGGSSDTGGSSPSGGTGTGGNWGGAPTGGSSGCNTLENIGTYVLPVADPAPLPEMTGGSIADGIYVLTSIVNYAGASADTNMIKSTLLITDAGKLIQGVISGNGAPDAHTTSSADPSGNELNRSPVCPEPLPQIRQPYTATPTSLTLVLEHVAPNLVTTLTRPECVGTVNNHFCSPDGFPFVQRAFAVTELCPGVNCHPPNPTLTQPEPGRLCMSGTVPPRGWHGVRLSFFPATQDGSEVVSAFDADALGIAQISFTLDSPPASGITVDATNIAPHDCTGPIFDCLVFGFTLPLITEPGTTTLPLVDFLQTDDQSPNQTFDTSSIGGIAFGVGEGPYDFCVRDFKFLDDAGDEVNP